MLSCITWQPKLTLQGLALDFRHADPTDAVGLLCWNTLQEHLGPVLLFLEVPGTDPVLLPYLTNGPQGGQHKLRWTSSVIRASCVLVTNGLTSPPQRPTS